LIVACVWFVGFKGEVMEAIQLFLIRYQETHARVARLTAGLTEPQIRENVHPAANPLAWILWHVARVEDTAVNLLVGAGPQVLDDAWMTRLHVVRRDFGLGMPMAEVLALSAGLDLAAWHTYWTAVGERTATLVAGLTPGALDEVISPAHIHWAVIDEQMVQGPNAARVEAFWQGMTKGYCLIYLALTHTYEHIGEADLLRGLLGLRGAF
jgi:hypothetical protein